MPSGYYDAGSQQRDGYTPEQVAFMLGMHRRKLSRHRPYPTWREVFRWALEMGYRRVMSAGKLPVSGDVYRGWRR